MALDRRELVLHAVLLLVFLFRSSCLLLFIDNCLSVTLFMKIFMYLLLYLVIDASGDDLEGSGSDKKRHKGKGDRVVASGDGRDDGYDDSEEVHSGSGSGMGSDDDDYDVPRYPTRPVRPVYPTRRPLRPNPPPDGDIGFQNPNNPKYDINKPNKKGEKIDDSGASSVSTSALLIVSTIFMVLRVFL